jgi:hypothetical protein
MNAPDAALATLATMRLHRLVAVDDLGEWWVRRPAARWAAQRPLDHWRSKAVSGLECPFCAGFWLGVAVLAAHAVLPRGLWRFGVGALALNEVVGHLGARVGDVPD